MRTAWDEGVIRRSFGNGFLIWSRLADGWPTSPATWVSDQTVYGRHRQERIDQGLDAGLTSGERAELMAVRRRIRELEAELAIHRKAATAA